MIRLDHLLVYMKVLRCQIQDTSRKSFVHPELLVTKYKNSSLRVKKFNLTHLTFHTYWLKLTLGMEGTDILPVLGFVNDCRVLLLLRLLKAFGAFCTVVDPSSKFLLLLEIGFDGNWETLLGFCMSSPISSFDWLLT